MDEIIDRLNIITTRIEALADTIDRLDARLQLVESKKFNEFKVDLMQYEDEANPYRDW